MYACGITPYDATHLGHANTYLAFDLVTGCGATRATRSHYIQNATDVDDPLLERAQATGVDWHSLAEREIELFRTDMEALRILPPREYVGVAEAIVDRVADLIGGWRTRAHLRLDGDVYFCVADAPKFGHVSGYDRADARPVRRARRRPRAARQAPPARLAAVAGRAAGRAVLGLPARPGAARLAHRVHRHRAATTWAPASTSRAAAPT